jgi:hypothetical protein
MVDKLFPDTVVVLDLCLDTEFTLDSLGGSVDDFFCKVGQLGDHGVDGGIKEGPVAGGPIACNPERKVALDNCRCYKGTMADTSSARDLLCWHVGSTGWVSRRKTRNQGSGGRSWGLWMRIDGEG